jgi:diguanylate cyclase (GGDEF)-like protein/PAS domain S-box-containing protein
VHETSASFRSPRRAPSARLILLAAVTLCLAIGWWQGAIWQARLAEAELRADTLEAADRAATRFATLLSQRLDLAPTLAAAAADIRQTSQGPVSPALSNTLSGVTQALVGRVAAVDGAWIAVDGRIVASMPPASPVPSDGAAALAADAARDARPRLMLGGPPDMPRLMALATAAPGEASARVGALISIDRTQLLRMAAIEAGSGVVLTARLADGRLMAGADAADESGVRVVRTAPDGGFTLVATPIEGWDAPVARRLQSFHVVAACLAVLTLVLAARFGRPRDSSARRAGLAALMGEVPASLALYDASGRRVWATRQWTGLMGDGESDHGPEATAIAALVARVHAQNAGESLEIRVALPDGGHVEQIVDAEPLRMASGDGGVLLTTIDVTAVRRAERRTGETEARWRALVENTSDLMLVIDGTGAVAFSAPAAQRLLNRTPESLVGRPLDEIIHEDDRAAFARMLRGVPGALVAPRWLRLAHAGGGWRVMEVAANDRRGDPAVGGLVLNLTDVTRGRELEAMLQHEIRHDALTGLANRRAFTERLTDALSGMRAANRTLAAILLDIDDFRAINDTYGVHVGDEVLRAVAARLRQAVRHGADARPALDEVARLDGNTFGLIIDAQSGGHDIEPVVERILSALSEPVSVGGIAIHLRASMGSVVAGSSHVTAGQLLRDAELALDAAKARGPGRHVAWAPPLGDQMQRRRALVNDLAGALDRGELLLHYQPIVQIDDGTAIGVEALLRWQHPTMGLLGPGAFLDLAEDTGLIVPIGNWVIGEALRQLTEWRMLYGRDLVGFVSVNASGRQFDHPNLLIDTIADARRANLPLDRLKLEITETTMVRNSDELRLILAQLCEQGATIAIDDFGVGYSSLAGLRLWEFDTIKIDRSFVVGMETPRGADILKTLLQFAHVFRASVVAEGVETEEQRAFLRRHGCRHAQGYLFSKPMDAATCGAYLLRQANLRVA